jgi:predicted naringenin-chalcone synthase
MTIVMAGIGSALPPGWLSQSDAASAANRLRRFDDPVASDRELQLLSALYRRSGVQRRHSVLLRAGLEHPVDRQTFYEEASHRDDRGPTTAARMQRYEIEAPELAEQACRQALESAGITGEAITHLVTVSCSGFNSPGFDLALYPRLGLSPETARTHVGFMGCHGALNGLRVARALAAADPRARVLMCAVELCTLHHQYTDQPQQIVANSLFADGAAATVIQASEAGQSETPKSPSRNGGAKGQPAAQTAPAAQWHIAASGSFLVPKSTEAMTWRIGDHGFSMTLSAQVPEMIKAQLRPWLAQWLGRHELTVDAVRHWAVHPGGPRILSATAGALGLADDSLAVSSSVLAECGNMSSPTILFILQRLLAAGVSGPCVALAFGPGLVVEAALLRPAAAEPQKAGI